MVVGAKVNVGVRVEVRRRPGVVRFMGETSFASGVWVGVELDTPDGKNNGEVNGVRYFLRAKRITAYL